MPNYYVKKFIITIHIHKVHSKHHTVVIIWSTRCFWFPESLPVEKRKKKIPSWVSMPVAPKSFAGTLSKPQVYTARVQNGEHFSSKGITFHRFATPLELRIAPCLCGSCFSTSLYSTSIVKFRAPLLCGSCFSTCLYGTLITTLRYFYGLIKAAFEPSSVNRILNTDDNIPKNTRKMIVPIQVVFEPEAVQKEC